MNAGARDMRLTEVNPARTAAACLAVQPWPQAALGATIRPTSPQGPT